MAGLLHDRLNVCLPLDFLKVNSQFGYRKDPVFKCTRFHDGIDLKCHYDYVYSKKIYEIEDQMREVQDNLDNITRYTIEWFRGLKKKYGKEWPRLTEISSLENITVTKVVSP